MSEARDEDDLEYYIKFPAPSPKIAGETDDFCKSNYDEREPVVFLYGWAGCRESYLAKYSAIYEERGCITIRYIAPLNTVYWQRRLLYSTTRRLLQLIPEMNLEEHPIFFHVFSNTGGLLYNYTMQHLPEFEPKLDIRGAVFDSTPTPHHFHPCYLSSSAILADSYGQHWYIPLLAFLFTVLAMIKGFIDTIWGYIMYRDASAYFIYKHIKEDKNIWPELYLYSQGDPLIDPKCVQDLVKYRRSRGVNVSEVFFGDSPHVQHLRVFRDQYIEAVHHFLQENTTMKGCAANFNES